VKQTFRPEFLNRVDEVIVFHALSHEQIKQIVDLMLARVTAQLRGQDMSLEVSDAVRELLAKEGFDRALGARPLRRAIQKLVEDPLAEQVLHGDFREGDSIMADLEDGRIVFRKVESLAEVGS
jgi:ATP-dependent Clp protease ATP-binding subunit ClpC